MSDDRTLAWVVLTMGDRPVELEAALRSIRDQDESGEIVVVQNGGEAIAPPSATTFEHLPENVGIPAGRDLGLRRANAAFVAFLDDDAHLLRPDAATRVLDAFESDPGVGAVALRIVDPGGATARRHVPRAGEGGAEEAGDVATFLGGACAVRVSAYEHCGGYWGDLVYAHEELDLAWRLQDAGYVVRYLPDVLVEHPPTTIGRHAEGWWRTGRNRVMVARRDLPWPVAIPHVLVWLVLGWWRAPSGECRRGYLAGWRAGWRERVPRIPMAWRTVWALSRRGRPPVV